MTFSKFGNDISVTESVEKMNLIEEYRGAYSINGHPLIPVLVGGDVLIYSFARMFSEKLNIRPIILISEDVKIVTTTKFANVIRVRNTDNEAHLISVLHEIAEVFSPISPAKVILGTGDWYARIFSFNAEVLSKAGYAIPYCDYSIFDEITQKYKFQSICSELGIDTPKTLILPCSKEEPYINPASHGFDYPVIAKPSNSAEWHYVDFPQKAKIMELNSESELELVYKTLKDSSYDKELLVQDKIPGWDDSLYSITCFSWKGNVEFSVLGHVLLQDHAPSAIGNPVVIVGNTEMPNWKVRLLSDAEKFLKRIKYSGFTNFDVMYDSRDDTYRFLEVNARLGRNSWYLNLAGIDVPQVIIDHYVLPMYDKDVKVTYGDENNSVHAFNPFVFKMVPDCVINKYAKNCNDKKEALSRHSDLSPVICGRDSLSHSFWACITNGNQIRKFKKYVSN